VFDFRYHALSLVAVFLALGIGILLGATIGEDLVSEADRDVRSSLRGDVVDARAGARDAREDARRQEAILDAAFPRMAGERLAGRSIAIFGSGEIDDDVQSEVRRTVEDAGGNVSSVSSLARELTPQELAQAAGGRFAGARTDDELTDLGTAVGRAIVRGGGRAERLEDRLPERFSGDWERVDGIVFVRAPGEERPEGMEPVEAALVEELADSRVPVVGVEATDADPSQVPFYLDRGISSVDDVDLAGGRIALALVLAGAEGSFGVKGTAEDLLPPLEEGDGGR
jgi:hypothetical protein